MPDTREAGHEGNGSVLRQNPRDFTQPCRPRNVEIKPGNQADQQLVLLKCVFAFLADADFHAGPQGENALLESTDKTGTLVRARALTNPI